MTWFIVLIVYLFSASFFASGYADSDEFLTMATTFSVPHPSGFPLLVLLSGLFIRMLPFLAPAHAGNLAASVFQSISVAAYTTITHLFLSKLAWGSKRNASSYPIIISILSGLILAFSGHYWLYGSVLEAASLTNALVSLTLLSGLTWYFRLQANRSSVTYFYLTFFLAGVSLSSLHTAVLVLPTLLVILLVSRSMWQSHTPYRYLSLWFKAIGLGLLGFFIPNLILIFLNRPNPSVIYSWFFQPNLTGWWRHVWRRDYAGFFPEEGVSREAYMAYLGKNLILAQPEYLHYLLIYFMGLGPVLMILGLIFLYRQRRQWFWILGSFWFISGPLFLGYMGVPPRLETNLDSLMAIGVSYRQFLIAHFSSALLLPFGLFCFVLWLKNKVTTSLGFKVFLIFTLTYLGYLIYTQAPIGVQRRNQRASDYAHAMLTAVPENSVIICSSDLACFSLFYAQTAEKYRSDVLVLTKNDLYTRRFTSLNPNVYPLVYRDNPFYLAHLISYQLTQRPVFLTNPTSYYINYLGLDGNPFYLVPHGYLYQVSKIRPAALTDDFDYALSQQLITNPPAKNDYYQQGYYGYFSSLHTTHAALYANYQATVSAKFHLDLALSLFPHNSEASSWQERLSTYSPPERYSDPKYSPLNQLLTQMATASQSGHLDEAYDYLRKATLYDPFNTELRSRLINLYLQGGYPEEAVTESRHQEIYSAIDSKN